MGSFEYGEKPVLIEPTTDIVLQRLPMGSGDKEHFKLHRMITYHDETTEDSYTVPPNADFITDLASVPQLMTWLVPKSGRHLPAALVHDALVDDQDLDRYEADRIFRDGMGDLDVWFIRRWLMWSAVSIESIRKTGSTYIRIGSILTALVIFVLGIAATVSLFSDLDLVPWMGVRSWWEELLLGAAGAVVIPIVLGVTLWQPIWRAGVIAGIGVALLVPAMLLIATIYGGYRAAERLPRTVQYVVGAMVVVGSTIGFVYGLVG